MLARFADYEKLGVSHLIQIDPENYVAWRFGAGSLIKTDFQTLELSGRPDLPFDTTAIFDQMRREIAEIESGLPEPL